jgi:hypothetical protein
MDRWIDGRGWVIMDDNEMNDERRKNDYRS